MVSPCSAGYTDHHHLFGILEGKCVPVSTPQILNLVEMIVAALNASWSALNFWRAYQGLLEKNKDKNSRLFKNFFDAFTKFPALQIIFSSHLSMIMNVIQFALLYFLNVKLSDGSTAGLVASITSCIVKAFRARLTFFTFKFFNSFADDFSTYFPIPQDTRQHVGKMLNITTWTSTALFSILYVVLNELPLQSPHRVWLSSLAYTLETIAFFPVYAVSMFLAMKLSGLLTDHFKDAKDGRSTTIYRDFAHLFCAGIPQATLLFCSVIPALYPLSTNYVVPLREILIVGGSINYVGAQAKLYVHRERINNPDHPSKKADTSPHESGKDKASTKAIDNGSKDNEKVTTGSAGSV